MTITKVVSALVVGSLLAGCGGYTSDYVPPNDGRARVVWDDDRTVASLPSGSSADCTDAVGDVQGNPTRYRTYYGGSPSVVIWRPWIVVHSTTVGGPGPTVTRRPANPGGVTSGTGGIKSGGGSSGGGGVGSLGGGSSGGSSGGGGNGDIGKAAVVLVVVALLTLPIITLGLGLGRPEPSKEVAETIDQVNAYNDLARLPDSPCSVTAGAQ